MIADGERISMRTLMIWAALCAATAAAHSAPAAQRDGQRDFDWEIGTWTTQVRVLRNPLAGKQRNGRNIREPARSYR